ncbi:MAG: E2 binding domain-containing protein, partial [Olpidium bornovanus]
GSAIPRSRTLKKASCCLEALKIATLCGPRLDNYMMYSGTDGIYTYTFQHQRLEDCAVCGRQEITANVSRALLKRPSLRTASRSIYMPAPPSLELATRPNLEKPVSEFAQEGEIVSVTDALLPIALSLTVQYVD